ncbi:MAG: radical SAM protein [Candidatus Bathyarchaeia archaeon]
MDKLVMGSHLSGCRLVEQGFKPGACLTYCDGEWKPACKATLARRNNTLYRLIHSYAHKSPEQYLSIYQSGCNWSCKKCHSWRFTRYASGTWMSPKDIAKISKEYYMRNKKNMYKEPRSNVTSWHAHELCRGCGSCILFGKRSKYCPGKLRLNQLTLLDDLTWGPARNIISFTGGDLACNPEFYAEAAKEIKSLNLDLWVLFETNGYGLTPNTLDLFKEAGIDSFWLDIKAYDDKVHRKLTGVSNEWILELPAKIIDMDFVLEVSTVYIPGWVEEDQIGKIAKLLVQVDPAIPYAIIAFIPENELINVQPPSFQQMVRAFKAAKDAGLKNVRLGNIGIFVRTTEEYEELIHMGAF